MRLHSLAFSCSIAKSCYTDPVAIAMLTSASTVNMSASHEAIPSANSRHDGAVTLVKET